MMQALLDTHIAIWAVALPEKLPPVARDVLEDEANLLYVSTVSLWEVAIKHELHPDLLSMTAADFADLCRETGFRILSLEPGHVLSFEMLEARAGHKDPFDRMLLAQAQCEGLRFVTHDAKVGGYGKEIVLLV